MNIDTLPLHFEIAVDSLDVEAFLKETMGSTTKHSDVFYDFEALNDSGMKIAESYKVDLVHQSGDPVYNGVYLSPYGDAGLDSDDDDISQTAGAMYVYKQAPVSAMSGHREYVLDKHGQPVVIYPRQQKQFEVKVKPEDKIVHLSRGSIPRLATAFTLANMAKDPNANIPKIMEKVDDFDDPYHDLNKQYIYGLDENGEPIFPSKNDEVLSETDEKKFLDAFNSRIEPRNEESLNLKPGVRLFVKNPDLSSPSRPPGGAVWKQFVCKGFGNSKAGKTVKFEIKGCEMDLGSQEGRIIEFPMKEEYIDHFLDVFGHDTYKVGEEYKDFKLAMASLAKSKTGHEL